MAATFLDLTNRVLNRLNEVALTSSTFAAAPGVHAAAREAVADTVSEINHKEQKWPFNSTVGTQVLTIAQEEYTWPAGLLVPDWDSFYIEKDDTLSVRTTPLRLINRNEWNRFGRPVDADSTTVGRTVPHFVFPSDTGFGVTPSPNAAYTVKFLYYATPATLTLYSDVVTIPTSWEYVVTAGALAKMNQFKEDPQFAQMLDEKYKEYVKTMRAVLINRMDRMANTMVNFGGGSKSDWVWRGY